jgi:uncharacterized protein YukE
MPTNYDAANLYCDPDGVKVRADGLTASAQDVVDSLTNIENTLTDLQLGWAGQTADEAKDFGDRWDAVMRELFGTKEEPDTGVLNAIVDGLLSVRGNYALAEEGLVEFFKNFAGQLSSGGGGGSTPTSAPPSVTDIDLTAISEVFGG